MNFKKINYIISAPSKKYWVDDTRKEIAIVGRSNVGKSTLINKLANNNSIAKVSSKPGYTKYLNFFNVDDLYYLVDTPGYGYAIASYTRDAQFEKMMREYINERTNLCCVIVLIDMKVGFTNDDLLLLSMLNNANREVQIIATKEDKVNQAQKHQFNQKAKEILNEKEYANLLTYSALKNNSIDKIIERIYTIYSN